MSKELNIIEAMHMKLGTEFTIKYRDGYTRRVMLVESNEIGNNNIVLKYLDGINNESNYVDIHRDLVDAKFIPIQKPVSFMEAVQSGRLFRVEHNNINEVKRDKRNIDNNDYLRLCCNCLRKSEYMLLDDFLFALGYLFSDSVATQILIEGKFYIKED